MAGNRPGRKPKGEKSGEKVLAKLPKPVLDMGEGTAMRHYRRIGNEAIRLRILTRRDLDMLCHWALATEMVELAMVELRKGGLVVESDAGSRQHPAAAVLKQSQATAMRCAELFGMAPSRRKDVPGIPKEKKSDVTNVG